MRVDDTDDLIRRLTADEDIPLTTLTEPELGAVTRFDAPGGRLVPLPFLDHLPADDRAAAIDAARAALHDRGLIDEFGVPTGNLAKLLLIRVRPRTVAVADRTANRVTTRRYLYGRPLTDAAEAFLEEATNADGAHHFTLRSHASATGSLLTYVDPDERARTDGPPRACQGMDASSGWREVDQALLRAETVTRLFSTSKRPDAAGDTASTSTTSSEVPRSRRASVVAGPGGVFIIAGQVPATSEDEATHGALLLAQSVSRATLRAFLTEFVTPARRRDHAREHR